MTPAERSNETATTTRSWPGSRDGATLEQASAELETFAARAWRPSVRIARHDGREAGPGRRADGARDQAHAAADRRQRRPAAAGRQRERGDAAARARVEPAARARGARRAWRDRAHCSCRWRSTESLVLACLGGLAGLFSAAGRCVWCCPLFGDRCPPAIRRSTSTRAWRSSRAAISVRRSVSCSASSSRSIGPTAGSSDVLKSSGRTITPDRAGRARNALVIAQVALAVVLLSAAGLMLNSVVKLSRVHPGFDADHLLTFRLALTGSNYARAVARRVRVRVCSSVSKRCPAFAAQRSSR